jgi:hypothetical protein
VKAPVKISKNREAWPIGPSAENGISVHQFDIDASKIPSLSISDYLKQKLHKSARDYFWHPKHTHCLPLLRPTF